MSSNLELSEAFRLFDHNNDGEITREEVKEFFDRLGSDEVSRAEMEALMKKSDRDGSGSINVEEFKTFWKFLKGLNPTEEEILIREAFNEVDLDKNGYISKSEMLKVMGAFDHLKGDEKDEALKCIEELDVDGDGKVSFPEFLLSWKFKL